MRGEYRDRRCTPSENDVCVTVVSVSPLACTPEVERRVWSNLGLGCLASRSRRGKLEQAQESALKLRRKRYELAHRNRQKAQQVGRATKFVRTKPFEQRTWREEAGFGQGRQEKGEDKEER